MDDSKLCMIDIWLAGKQQCLKCWRCRQPEA